MSSEMFVNTHPVRLFFRCAVPAVVTSVFGALYSVVDGVFAGRYLGGHALAAVNIIMPVIMIVEAAANMIATGSSVNISILLGEGKRKEASEIFSFSVKFIIILSCIAGVCGFIFAGRFIEFISPGAGKEAIDMGTEYLRIYSLAAPLVPVYFATDNYLRVCGKQKTSMVINIASQLANIILDYLLIAVFHKGMWAAAFASCFSIAAGSLFSLIIFAAGKMDLYYIRSKISLSQFLHIIANGSSEFFSAVSVSVMSIIMNLFLLKYGGTTAVAAFSVVMYADGIIGMINFGICDSLQPAISYCYGSGERKRLKEIFKTEITAVIIISVISFLFMFYAGPFTTELFVKPGETELLAVSITAVKIFAFSYLTGWTDMCFSSFFTSIDKPFHSLVVSVSGSLILPVIFLFVLAHFFGLNGVWAMAPAASAVSCLLTLVYCIETKMRIIYDGTHSEKNPAPDSTSHPPTE